MAIALTVTLIGVVKSQDRGAVPVPFWRDDGLVSPEYRDRHVFLTRDRHTLVVLVPADVVGDVEGPKTVVKVPLLNDLAASLSVSIAKTPSDKLSYQYTVVNGPKARDAIGAWSLIIPATNLDLELGHPEVEGRMAWSGAPAYAVIAKQAIFPAAPLGRYLLWFHQDKNYIRSGEKLDKFSIKTSFRPGLTTAWFSSGNLLAIDQDWPKQIFEELEWLEDRRWTEQYVVTVGPMFPPDMPAKAVAASFRASIAQIQQAGWVKPSSPFAQDVAVLLQKMGQIGDSSEPPLLHTHPSTTTECAIAAALKFSLGVTSAN